MGNNIEARHNGFSVAALIFGVLAFVTSIVAVLLPLNAGLCFTFAFLSRGDGRMGAEAKIGIVFAIIGIIIGIAIVSAAALFAGRFFMQGSPDVFRMMPPYGGLLR